DYYCQVWDSSSYHHDVF
nr:immunoglobulin light chain junction region [Macaca mulatta]MOX77667.1 immunoglobulin light chain junction region [Macaca mulatta]MOX77755.1 immunoglobulin light chain junction region [Macaca mulatta]MOX79396.1 immunoglobulin light chain junction region [Macaca mulatta]